MAKGGFRECGIISPLRGRARWQSAKLREAAPPLTEVRRNTKHVSGLCGAMPAPDEYGPQAKREPQALCARQHCTQGLRARISGACPALFSYPRRFS